MIRWRQPGREHRLTLVSDSPLRRVDPRVKLALCLGISLTVMLPLSQMVIFMSVYVLFLWWSKLLRAAWEQVWRLKWVLILLFAFGWWMVGLTHAGTVVARLALLSWIFSLFFSTTTAHEFSLALEHLSVPYRYAFSLRIAMQSVGILSEEWRAIKEAQVARGAWQKPSGVRAIIENIGQWISLTVRAVVMATKRAWSITEAAYARGFNSPRRLCRHFRPCGKILGQMDVWDHHRRPHRVRRLRVGESLGQLHHLWRSRWIFREVDGHNLEKRAGFFTYLEEKR